IRDFHVTGVQTCALPIWQHKPMGTRAHEGGQHECAGTLQNTSLPARLLGAEPRPGRRLRCEAALDRARGSPRAVPPGWYDLAAQIGRASGRERVELAVVG